MFIKGYKNCNLKSTKSLKLSGKCSAGKAFASKAKWSKCAKLHKMEMEDKYNCLEFVLKY